MIHAELFTARNGILKHLSRHIENNTSATIVAKALRFLQISSTECPGDGCTVYFVSGIIRTQRKGEPDMQLCPSSIELA